MDKNSSILLRVLLNAYYKNNANMVCRFLPDDQAEQIKSMELTVTDFSFAFRSPEEYIEKIHYSWIASVLIKFPATLRAIIAAALPNHQSSCLRQLLTLDKIPTPVEPARIFLQKMLYDALNLKDISPEELLPQTPFRILCDWNKKKLCSLIDLLSMHDLAEKLRHIVDRKRLRDIYACLNQEKLGYLRHCMQARDKIVSSELNLDQWKGNPKELELLLHRRGLVRFGKALSTEPQEILWHILHRLDTGRSGIIEKCLNSPSPLQVTQVLAEQTQNIIKYLDKKSTL